MNRDAVSLRRPAPDTPTVRWVSVQGVVVRPGSGALNEIEAKAVVISILRDWFGWKSVIDLGDIQTSRGVEMFVVLWQSLRNWTSSHRFNIKVVT